MNKRDIMKAAAVIEKNMKTKKYTLQIGDSYRSRAMRETWANAKAEAAFKVW